MGERLAEMEVSSKATNATDLDFGDLDNRRPKPRVSFLFLL